MLALSGSLPMPPARRAAIHRGHAPKRLNSKWHRVADAQGRPVRLGLTQGTRAGCTQAVDLMAGLEAEDLVADRGYDRDPVVAAAWAQGMVPGIPPRRHCKQLRTYDPERYPWRHRRENAFLAFKPWRGVATR